MVAVEFTHGESFQYERDGDVVRLILTREQAEELFSDLFIKLTDKSEDGRSK